ncbi:TIR domain-containing protein [Candidatus Parcubacteria bacterium]|nr:TIR domain-containing protein [Candidatus Parcubacteria bacterium]
MNNPRTFVSFDYDHNDQSKIRFVGQSKNSKTPFFIKDWSSKSSLPQSQWEKIVKEKINKCNIVIVLAGKFMASASGVAKEIAMAKEQNVPFFGVYVGGANEKSRLPIGLNRNRTIKWTWNGIASAIDQLMGEGKNK